MTAPDSTEENKHASPGMWAGLRVLGLGGPAEFYFSFQLSRRFRKHGSCMGTRMLAALWGFRAIVGPVGFRT